MAKRKTNERVSGAGYVKRCTYGLRIPPAAQRGRSSRGYRRSSMGETHPSCRTRGIQRDNDKELNVKYANDKLHVLVPCG